MDRIKGRMTPLVLILLLLLLSAIGGMVVLHVCRDFYRKNALLRVDPLEFTRVKAADYAAELKDSEIWMIGDSRVRRWPEELLESSATVTNLGVEGQTSSQVLYRFMNYLETDTPSLVILEVGINDLKTIGLDDRLASSITQQYYGNIEQMIYLCKGRNIKMILINIFTVGKIDMIRRLAWNSAVNEAINAANLRLKSYRDDDVIFYFDANAILSDNGRTVRPEYRDDFLHINTKGYESLSSGLQELINKVKNHN